MCFRCQPHPQKLYNTQWRVLLVSFCPLLINIWALITKSLRNRRFLNIRYITDVIFSSNLAFHWLHTFYKEDKMISCCWRHSGASTNSKERKNSVTEKNSRFSNHVLDISDDIGHLGPVKWQLCLMLLCTWVIVFVVLIKGIHSLGKVFYRFGV